MDDLLALHNAALDDLVAEVEQVIDDDLARPSPCAEWVLSDLLAHMIGQHLGFAEASATGTANVDAYRPVGWARPVWNTSIETLRSAFAGADPDARVLEVELHPTRPLEMTVVVGAQLLDTAVHAWDVATTVGNRYRPADAIVAQVLSIAENIPDGDNRDGPNAAFAHVESHHGVDDWHRCLALLGRRPDDAPAPNRRPA